MANGLNLNISYEEGIEYTANMLKDWIEEDGELTMDQLLDSPIYPVCQELEDDFGDDTTYYIEYVVRRSAALEFEENTDGDVCIVIVPVRQILEGGFIEGEPVTVNFDGKTVTRKVRYDAQAGDLYIVYKNSRYYYSEFDFVR